MATHFRCLYCRKYQIGSEYMSNQNLNSRERKRNDLDDVFGLLRLRLMDAVYDEVNSCGETVAKVLDDVLPEVSSFDAQKR